MNDLFVVPLTQGHFAIVDAEDAPLVAPHKWHAYFNFGTWYAKGRPVAGSRHQVTIHRQILGIYDGRVVDHVNHNGLDNRRSNLRACTRAENIRNQSGPRANNNSGYLGVFWCKHRGRWRAKVVAHGKAYTLGRFTCPIEAAIARDVAAIHLHGEFASLNFPEMREVFATEADFCRSVPDGNH